MIRSKKEKEAIEFMDKYDIDPGYVEKRGITALILACFYRLEKLSLEIISRFGNACKPEQVDTEGDSALGGACQYKMTKVIVKLIETFGDKCIKGKIPTDLRLFVDTILVRSNSEKFINLIKDRKESVALEFIDNHKIDPK